MDPNRNTLRLRVSAECVRSPTFPWCVKAAGSSVEGAPRSDPEHQTYTNMAMPRLAAPQPSVRSALCLLLLLLLCVSGVRSSTLHLRAGPARMLPQDRGFFTVEANADPAGGDGAASLLAARAAAEGGSDSGAYPPHRSRRSAGESAMPKVYGQVMRCLGESRRCASPPAALSGEAGRLGTGYASPPVLFSKSASFLAALCSRMRDCCTVVCVRVCLEWGVGGIRGSNLLEPSRKAPDPVQLLFAL